jgi:hypothetical protein
MPRADLGAYLQAALPKRWDWTKHDCCRFVAGWVVARGHPDPLDTVETYATEREAFLRIARGGGLVALWERGANYAGLSRATGPRKGDIGVLSAPQEAGPPETVGIYTGDKWAMLGMSGLIFAHPEPLAMWRP